MRKFICHLQNFTIIGQIFHESVFMSIVKMENDVSNENDSIATSSFVTVNNTFAMDMNEINTTTTTDAMETQLQEALTREKILIRRVADLQFEIEIKNNNARLNQSKQLQNTLAELIEACEKIDRMHTVQRDLHGQIDDLQTKLKEINDKCTEMQASMRTSPSPANAKCVERLGIVECQLVLLTTERDEAIAALEAARIEGDRERRDLEQRLDDLIAQETAFNHQLTVKKEIIDEHQVEIVSTKQQKSDIESRLATLQTKNQMIFEEKKKLTDDFVAISSDNEKMSSEIVALKHLVEQRNDEINKMVEQANSNALVLAQVRKIALRYRKSFNELQQKSKFEFERVAKIQMQNDTLIKQLCESDANHSAAMKTVETLTEDKHRLSSELTAIRTQLANSDQTINNIKSRIEARVNVEINDRNQEEIVRLTHDNKALQARLNRLDTIPKMTTQEARTKNVKMPNAGKFRNK